MATGRHDRKIVVLKIGTATLTGGGHRIRKGKVEDIAAQIANLQDRYQIVIVCSGAIAAAHQVIQLEHMDDALEQKQALAAIGQPYLMRVFEDIFREHRLHTGQCLLSYQDFAHAETRLNMRNTLETLLKHGVVPVINENDTVSTDEIQFGDNDRLSSLVAELMGAHILILATNTDGLLDEQKSTIEEIQDLSLVKRFVGSARSKQGTGGMLSKLEAAGYAQQAGIECWIVNGQTDDFLLNALSGTSLFSRIIP